MFDSVIVEVVIGVSFVFFLASILASGIHELFAGLLSMRSHQLEQGLKSLLGDPDAEPTGVDTLFKKVRDHPLIRDLERPAWMSKRRKAEKKSPRTPSYIPSRTFALALAEVALPDADTKTRGEDLRAMIAESEDIPESVKGSLTALLDEPHLDLKRFRKRVEQWYDDTMDRVSGWYRRRTRWLLLLWGLVLAVGVNVDAFTVAGDIWRDDAVRQAVVATAESQAAGSLDEVADAVGEIEELDLAIGWTSDTADPRVPDDFLGWLAKTGGWLVTAIAATLGAPFWFDLLGRLSQLRAAGAKPTATGSTP